VTRHVIALSLAGLIGGVTTHFEEAAAQPPADPLLAEVRALHADINQLAGTSVRTQVLIVRLQAEEQRIASISRELDEVRKQLTTLPSGLVPLQGSLQQIEMESRSTNATQEERSANELAASQVKAQIADVQRQIGIATERESALSAALAAEQSRWMDFSERLDQIERELRK
jgi:hypothetical protein